MVKIYNLLQSALVVLLLTSTTAWAESQYPAADFQPEVLYQDTDYIDSQSGSAKEAAPAVEATSDISESSEGGSEYPAANYQPEVLYQDTDYIAKHRRAPEAATGSADESIQAYAPAVKAKKKEESSQTMLFALVAPAIVGFVFYNKSKTGEQAASPAYTADPSGLTGVERYLGRKPSATGVEKYLASHKLEAPATGVAKYMAKKVIEDKEAATTGVEKYLRNQEG